MAQEKQVGTPIQPTGDTRLVVAGDAEKPSVWRISAETAKAIEGVERNSREAVRLAVTSRAR